MQQLLLAVWVMGQLALPALLLQTQRKALVQVQVLVLVLVLVLVRQLLLQLLRWSQRPCRPSQAAGLPASIQPAPLRTAPEGLSALHPRCPSLPLQALTRRLSQ